jgi:hypothetical protein
MALVLSIFTAAGLVLMVFYYWNSLLGNEEGDLAQLKATLGWAAKAMVFPILVWVLINCGVFPGVPILMRRVALARAAGEPWAGMVMDGTAVALFVIATYWSGLAFVWLILKLYRAASDPKEFRGVALFWGLLLLPFAAALGWLGGYGLAGATLTLWLLPVVHLVSPLMRAKPLPASYSKATALLKLGRFNEAEWEVIRELEKHENDFEGWLLLAELYATQFGDVASAEQTIYDICSQPETNPSQMCTALYKLSDWHLKVSEDPQAAREVLEVICKKWPGTHLDKMARLRIQQMPVSREELLRKKAPHRIRLPALKDDIEDPVLESPVSQSKEEAVREANRLVQKLEIDSNDVAAREEFARLLAERLEKSEQGIEQLELLMEMPELAENKRAEWLAMIASWHFKHRKDQAAGKAMLEQIIERFPQSVQAFTAQRRLSLMQVEEKMKRNRGGAVSAVRVS